MWVPHPRTVVTLLREFMLSWLAGKQTCYLLLAELFFLKPPFLPFLLLLALLAKLRWRRFHEKESLEPCSDTGSAIKYKRAILSFLNAPNGKLGVTLSADIMV